MSIKSEVQGFDISDKSAVIAGCGGLGTNAAVHLAGAGIGRLMLVDHDAVEKKNLNRQFFYTQNDVGEEKSRLLAERIKAYSPETEVEFRSEKFRDDFARDYDIIIIAVDNIAARKEINAYCVKSSTPCVNGSINGFFGTAYMYVPGKTPDLEAAGCLEEPPGKTLSPSTTAAVIGALEAKLAIDFFTGNIQSGGKLYIFDDNEIHTLKIRSDGLD